MWLWCMKITSPEWTKPLPEWNHLICPMLDLTLEHAQQCGAVQRSYLLMSQLSLLYEQGLSLCSVVCCYGYQKEIPDLSSAPLFIGLLFCLIFSALYTIFSYVPMLLLQIQTVIKCLFCSVFWSTWCTKCSIRLINSCFSFPHVVAGVLHSWDSSLLTHP